MSEQPTGKGTNTAVIIAVIGLLGTLITGVLTSPVLVEYLKRNQGTPTPTIGATATDTPLPQPSITPTLSEVRLTFISNTNCRIGPGTGFSVTTSFKRGDVIKPNGRIPDGTWYRVVVPNTVNECWVSASSVSLSGSIEQVPTVQP